MPTKDKQLTPAEPSPAHWSSDRAVFRLQRYINDFRENLRLAFNNNGQEHYFTKFESAILIPIDPRSEDYDGNQNFYLAKFCATYSFADHTIELLKAICNYGKSIGQYYEDKNITGIDTGINDITCTHFKSLFEARNKLRSGWNRMPEGENTYDEFVAAINTPNLKHLPNHFYKAHELFVETASCIPYRGRWPTMLDEVAKLSTNRNVFSIAFRHIDTDKVKYINSINNSEQDAKLDQINFPDELRNDEESLSKLLKTFVNSFLLDPSWQGSEDEPFREFTSNINKPQRLAIPLYENTKIEPGADRKFQGSYLGWVILLGKEEDLKPVQDEHWPLLSILLNHLAASVVTAMSDELVSDYADHARAKPLEAKNPFEYLTLRVNDMSGFITTYPNYPGAYDWDEPVDDPRISIPAGSSRKITLRKKKTTFLPEDSDGLDKYYIEFFAPRLQRTLRHLSAIHLSTQAETMRKYKQMMDLLSTPLHKLTGALAEMQRDTQELRAILYEPAQTIFESYQRISELFERGRRVQISKHMTILIAHNPEHYRDINSSWDKDDPDITTQSVETGRLCVITVLCRIFGLDDLLQEARSFKEFLGAGKFALSRAEEPAFTNLRRDLLWLWKVAINSNDSSSDALPIESLIDASGENCGNNMRLFLKAVKDVVFSPFKVDTELWDVRAIQLTMPKPRRNTAFNICEHVTKDSGLILRSQSPASYHTILGFLLGIRSSKISRQPEFCNITKTITDGNNIDYTIRITYSETFGICDTKLAKLRTLMESSLSNRDWRIHAANQGDFHGPFVHLANRLLGIVLTSDDEPNKEGWDLAEYGNGEVIALESRDQLQRKFVVSISDDTSKGKGILEIKWLNIPQSTFATKNQATVIKGKTAINSTDPLIPSSGETESSGKSFKCYLRDHTINQTKCEWKAVFDSGNFGAPFDKSHGLDKDISLNVAYYNITNIVFVHGEIDDWKKKCEEDKNLHVVWISTNGRIKENHSDHDNRFHTCWWTPQEILYLRHYEIKRLIEFIKAGEQEWWYWLQTKTTPNVDLFGNMLGRFITLSNELNPQICITDFWSNDIGDLERDFERLILTPNLQTTINTLMSHGTITRDQALILLTDIFSWP